ncbi:hypothetical protein GGS23DRAFT_595029 [Durotheca rogersii]|uniref:uncharacterized protein n=1 Tax=Durotheca rogersii TaxID=419775 RepID=UPI00221EF039|nr:uncharacterized protein GGS23DRAFT_595029 [Durotheca rogersii]KAI5865508.1 hypothetical protein GGS23DRAFT_595029 [Durotheca rogersii]
MSATMTMSFPPIVSAPISTMATSTTSLTTTPCCPNCGHYLPSPTEAQTALLDAQKQIEDLQAQVRLLSQKATAAVDRWADYEDELMRLRAASTTAAAAAATAATSQRSSFLPAGAASRISQLLTPRKSVPNLAGNRGSGSGAGSPPPPLPSQRPSTANPGAGPSAEELQQALTREKELRARAEGRLQDTSKEVEELSATLFEQANEMVATERRARAALEERVSVLERRDAEKRGRLERLEGAMERIERVRALLEDGAAGRSAA